MIYSEAAGGLCLDAVALPAAACREGPEEARRQATDACSAAGRAKPSPSTGRDVSVPGPRGGIGCRLYVPGAARVLPALLYMPGAAWVVGDLDSHDSVCRSLAS